MMVQMRYTLTIDEALLDRASELTGFHDKTALVHAALEALIAREAAKRLTALGGKERRLSNIPRRRPA